MKKPKKYKSTSRRSYELNESQVPYGQNLTFQAVWLMFRETDKKFQETDREIKETARLIRELREEYKSRWGELVESLVSGKLRQLLNERGIPVKRQRQRVRQLKGEPNYEFDIVAQNGNDVVVVEVKSKLDAEDVKHFIKQLRFVREHSQRFRDKQIIGAVAFLKDYCDASAFAINKGLFAIRATGDSAVILNEEGFQPLKY